MALIDDYRDSIVALLDRIVAERGPIAQAAAWVAEAWASDGLVYVVGSGHSHMIAEEVFYRAGGAAPVQAILHPPLMLHESATGSSALERREGLAETVLRDYPIAANDVVFVVSNSGRNAFPIEAALHAQQRRARVIALTSLATATRSPSRHSGGKNLHEIADLAIDNQVPHGDAVLDLPKRDTRMGPVSTVAGAFIMNAIMAEAIEMLAAKGVAIDVYRSANVEGSNAEEIVAAWRPRIKGL
jgi:uncharacterized phosphosugar-binding protein